MNKKRCNWANGSQEELDYHDEQWGVPERDDRMLFEMLILEGAQAGLSWSTIIKRRDGYRRAFDNFDVKKVARYSEKKQEKLLQDTGIIRNRLKVGSAVTNAKCFIEIQKEFGSFSDYIWQFTGGKPIVNKWKTMDQVPVTTTESDAMSKDLRKRGFKFVGSTICYAYMQANGLVNDHLVSCFRYKEVKK